MPELASEIEFDSELAGFSAYSKNAEALQKFALAFRKMCDDDRMMTDLFSRADLEV